MCTQNAETDPGFPVRGVDPLGAFTSDASAFW